MTSTVLRTQPTRVAVRRAALIWPVIAVIGFATFVVVVIAAGIGDPGYRPLSDGIGGLGAKNAADPDLMSIGFIALSVATVAAGIALLTLLPRKSGVAASLIVILAGIGVSALAFVRQDCSTAQARCATSGLATNLSTSHTVHRVLGVCILLALVVSLWLMVVSLTGATRTDRLAEMTVGAAIAGTTVFIWYGSELYGGLGGAVEGLLTLVVYGWPVFLAVALNRGRAASIAPTNTR